jgi:outer membrane protein assembly factor BamD (BamD/ComL family)
MNVRLSKPMGVAVVALATAIHPHADAAPKLFGFGKKEAEAPPGGAQLADQENRAAARLAQITATENQGRTGAAAKAYDKLADEFPFTKTAATARFRSAQLLERDGKRDKAFEAYQSLIEKHPQSPEYATALERQFTIANELRADRGGLLGFGKMTTDDLTEMYEKVIKNGTRSPYASKSQFAIAELYAERDDLGDSEKSTLAFQKVVDTYPDSPEAAEAAVRIGNVNFAVAQRSRDASNLTAAREAFESAGVLFGDNPEVAATQEKLVEISEQEAGKAFKTGQFYERKGQLKAAAIYYSEALKSPSAGVFADAQERLNQLSTRDPKLLDSMSGLNVASTDLAVPAKSDTVSRPDYFGPPPPPERNRKPKMRVDEAIPFTPIEEPALPTPGEENPMNEDLLLPPPPIPEAPATPEPAPAAADTPAAPEAPAAPAAPAPAEPAPAAPAPTEPAQPAKPAGS